MRTYNGSIGVYGGEFSGITFKRFGNRRYTCFGLGFDTYKKYLKTNAFQLSILGGTTTQPLFQKNYFSQSAKSHEELEGRPVYGGSFGGRYAIQLEYLRGKDISFSLPHAYLGIGAQLRSAKVNYDTTGISGAASVSYTETDFGIHLIAGLEYQIPRKPISFVVDFKPFFTLTDKKLLYWPQAGIGIRFCFIEKPDREYCDGSGCEWD
jgi:hypothetical protein